LSKMLSSWKEIAHFFGKGVRTVQRWEKTLDLPIHRPPGAPSNVVLARTSDLEEWMHGGHANRAAVESDEEATTSAAMTDALASLEREVTLLAQKTGVAAGEVHVVTSPVERISALTATLGLVHEHISSSRSARAA
jgi:hypothetical protein